MLPGEPLDAGHVEDRALGGASGQLRWEHAVCNRRAGGRLSQVLARTRKVVDDVRPSRRW